jgi:tetratricopeptide (TPR) repeat protein
MATTFLVRGGRSLGIFALLFGLFSIVRADQIVKTDGTAINGQITGISSGQVGITIGTVKSIVYLSDIKKVTMDQPPEMAQLKNAAPAQVVSTLEPLVKEYAGLPANWVLDAMGRLADAYDAQGHGDKATQIYAEIKQLYPNNASYQQEAIVGEARQELKEGQIAAAMNAVKPLIDEANKNVAPSPDDGRLFAKAFLVYGQALEAQKQYPQALEAYLTVKTMFYQNPALVTQADQLAEALRAQNPGVAVD